jgi:hypothetical protein
MSIFYDLNAKLSYKLDPNNNLFLSGYFGRDVFSNKVLPIFMVILF